MTNDKKTLYLIPTTSRSGSTYLCRLLAATGRLGNPDEYYNRQSKAERMRAMGVAGECEYFQALLRRTSTANAVCGIKLETAALAELQRALGPIFDLLRVKYIWLRRRDTLRQAISLYRATETDVWRRPVGEPPPSNCPPFDAERILVHRETIAAANTHWRRWFAEQAIEPLCIWYEDLAARPRETVAEICRFLDVDTSNLPAPASGLQVMRDAVTEAWMQTIRGAESRQKN